MPRQQIEPRTLTVDDQLKIETALLEQRRLHDALLATGLTPTQKKLLGKIMLTRYEVRKALALSEDLWALMPPNPVLTRPTKPGHRRPPIAL